MGSPKEASTDPAAHAHVKGQDEPVLLEQRLDLPRLERVARDWGLGFDKSQGMGEGGVFSIRRAHGHGLYVEDETKRRTELHDGAPLRAGGAGVVDRRGLRLGLSKGIHRCKTGSTLATVMRRDG